MAIVFFGLVLFLLILVDGPLKVGHLMVGPLLA